MKRLQAVTSIHYLPLKFPTDNDIATIKSIQKKTPEQVKDVEMVQFPEEWKGKSLKNGDL